jgi:hypothetical protein
MLDPARGAVADGSGRGVLTFTARGPVAESGDRLRAILDGLDLGRATIVGSFAAFMDEAANNYWGLRYASE